MDPRVRRQVRKSKLDQKRHPEELYTGFEVAKKDRKTKNRESAMLSRERKNMRMKALEEQNEQLRQENLNLRRMLYGRQSPTGVDAAPWKLAVSEHEPEVFIKL